MPFPLLALDSGMISEELISQPDIFGNPLLFFEFFPWPRSRSPLALLSTPGRLLLPLLNSAFGFVPL